jgi:HK97 family phage major capsid protein
METVQTFEKVDQAIHNLEESFKVFQEKHDKRFQQLYAAHNRPLLGADSGEIDHQKQAFVDYITQGHNNFQEKSLTSQEGPKGGFLIPTSITERIGEALNRMSPLRSLARITNISTDSLELLLDKGNADVGWVNEIEERKETETPELSKVRIPVHQIYAKPKASQKILDDASIDIESWLVGKIAEKMAVAENTAFIHGDGENKPTGFLNYEVVPVGEGAWGKLEGLDTGVRGKFKNTDILLDILSSMKPQYLNGAVWFMSRSAVSALRKVKDEMGGHSLWQPSLTAGSPESLLGYPIVISDDMPALVEGKSSQSIVFANFYEAYQIVDRASLHVLRDPYSSKPYVEFYITKRVGGDVINFDAIKVINFRGE